MQSHLLMIFPVQYLRTFKNIKKGTVSATKKFIADAAPPHGRIKSLRSDNGSEFKSDDFQRLLCDNRIRHETSVPYSPHQNGTAERNWRILFEMARCLVLFTNPSARAGYDTRSIFKRSLTGLNSEFSFS